MKFILHIVLFASLINAAAHDEIPVHYLKAPKLASEHVGKHVLCHRPMGRSGPHMSIEKRAHKVIIHNYGHGGSGWTFAPGCVRTLLQQFNDTYQVDRDASLAVIGAGVIGLFSAYMLSKLGFKNISVVAAHYDNLTSHKAGGFLAPSTVSGNPLDQEAQERIDGISLEAYNFYAEIARGENKDFSMQGVRFMPVYLKRHDDRLKAYEGRVMQEPQDVIIEFSTGKRYEMKVYKDALFMDTDILMASLKEHLRDKVIWQQKHIDSFEEIKADHIFNCAGLGASALNNDAQLMPVQGHLLMLKGQDPEDMNYMISMFVHEGITENGQHIKRSLYMFPKHAPDTPETSIGVLGGTFIEGAYEDTPNTAEFDLMIERARDFFGE